MILHHFYAPLWPGGVDQRANVIVASEWNTTADIVNHTQAGNVFMLGAGGIFGK